MHDDVFASHGFADLHRADVVAVARLDCREYFREKFLPPTTGTQLARHSSEFSRSGENANQQESEMKEIAARGVRLITLLRKKMRHAKRVRSRLAGFDFLGANGSPSRSVWFGADGGGLPGSLAPIPICRRRSLPSEGVIAGGESHRADASIKTGMSSSLLQ
jgi:hypothetical protein